MKLSQRTVLITGGSSGIGLALAEKLAAQDNQVIICGRNQNKLELAQAREPGLEIVQCDITVENDLRQLVSFLAARYPNLDLLINNAGIQQELDLTSDTITNEVITNEINTNLTGQINVTLRLYPLLTANQDASIVFLGSALGLVPKYTVPIYSAAKAGLHSFVNSLREQVARDGVQVVEVFPDVIETPMTRHRIDEAKMCADDFAENVIKHLLNDADEIYMGRTRMLGIFNRASPTLAAHLING